ncbi:response regulator transcription factor [Serpentinicella sp. ANB-PHB4]|uniref:response regulator transcription factor n=1 Tax=Serpentinicella sp. ANB-PHB4 TaxID=3074076 RepID=UPI002862CA21|nr:response regulator transcription factor [Serpentinicella sp. ANB-PHB4]MDR5659068.1 response regulator transcription factor [Serpentinicella sp. ANB-PHB4]
MKKILVVDDEETLRMLIGDTLEDLGFLIEEAENGEIALNKIQKNNYDLIILDYMMPKLTGLDVVSKLTEEEKKNTNILMLTAKAQEKDQQHAFEKGVKYFMPKPFSPIELCNLVEEILND